MHEYDEKQGFNDSNFMFHNMKCRTIQSQNSHSPKSLENITRRKTYTPLSRPKLRTITAQGLHAYAIDLTKRPTSESCEAEVRAVVQLQQRLQLRASQFISKLSKERMHLKGRLMLRKQEEEQRRQIKLEIERYERTLKDKKEFMEKREKHRSKVLFFQERAHERELIKLKTLKNTVTPKSKSFNHNLKLPKGKTHKSLLKVDESSQIKLKNSIYLDEEQRKIEQTRKQLIQLQSAINSVERLKLKC